MIDGYGNFEEESLYDARYAPYPFGDKSACALMRAATDPPLKSEQVAEEIFGGAKQTVEKKKVIENQEKKPASRPVIVPPAPPAIKPQFEYLDFRCLADAAEVMALNQAKHAEVNAGKEYSDGWKDVSITKHFGSLMRHLASYWTFKVSDGKFGEFYDQETGKPHLSHAFCRVMFILGIEMDNGKK